MIAHQGIHIEETMAFGDGGNDISIIEKAGIGIAIGNANQILKSHADYITSSVDENGIYNALQYFIFNDQSIRSYHKLYSKYFIWLVTNKIYMQLSSYRIID